MILTMLLYESLIQKHGLLPSNKRSLPYDPLGNIRALTKGRCFQTV